MEDLIDDPYFIDQVQALRSCGSVKPWWLLLTDIPEEDGLRRSFVYTEALKVVPGSYKLWAAYLFERRRAVRGSRLMDLPQVVGERQNDWEGTNLLFEKALVYMFRMPRIWIEYLSFLIDQRLITRTRRTIDRALQSLPISQHNKIWEVVLKFLKEKYVPCSTGVLLWKRYLMLRPREVEDYVEFLISRRRFGDAAVHLYRLLGNEKFVSKYGKTNHEMWLDLCELISKNAPSIGSLNAGEVIRTGIRTCAEVAGRLWLSLVEYYVRLANFGRAADIFEEAMESVMTVRDFSQVFDAYSKFQSTLIQNAMEQIEEGVQDEHDELDDAEEKLDLDLQMARFERLINNRPFLLNAVYLRQNPHNVVEWLKRAELFTEAKMPSEVVETYKKAITTVETNKASGKPQMLWVKYAQFVEDDIDRARSIFEEGVKTPMRRVDELATIYASYAELELRHGYSSRALDVIKRAVAVPPGKQSIGWKEGPLASRVWKSSKLWAFYADLEESFGSSTTTSQVYERALELGVATAQMMIHYTTYLRENHEFQKAFDVFEKCVELFSYPHASEIWLAYMSSYIQRHSAVWEALDVRFTSALFVARDIFERALLAAPADAKKRIFLYYAHFEEKHAADPKKMISVMNRACVAVPDDTRIEMYRVLLKKAQEYLGLPKTRPICLNAMNSLPQSLLPEMAVIFASIERRLGEIDRARAIFVHGSQFANPKATKNASFWKSWHEFEVHHGNEDTFKEMLRISRTVSTMYDTTVNFMAAQTAEAGRVQSEDAISGIEGLERRAEAEAEEETGPTLPIVEAIDLDDDEDEEESDGEMNLELKPVPASVVRDLMPSNT